MQRITGKIYSKYWLYPKLKKLLKGHVVDYGAGIGNFTLYCRRYLKTTPAEINLECINYMKSIGLNPIRIINSSTQIDDNFFDSALLDNVLDIKETMKDIKRIVKNHGNIIIGVPGILGFNSHWDHNFFFDEIELEKLCKLFDLELKGFMYAPFFKSEFLSKNLRQYCIYAKIINHK